MARSNYRGGTARRTSPKDLNRRIKKKPCAMCRDSMAWVDYKDVPLLRKYMSDLGKIRSRRVTGNCAQHQRAIASAIKTARELVLLPYTQRTVTERPGGRGGRGEGRGPRGEGRGSGEDRGERRSGPPAGAGASAPSAGPASVATGDAPAPVTGGAGTVVEDAGAPSAEPTTTGEEQ